MMTTDVTPVEMNNICSSLAASASGEVVESLSAVYAALVGDSAEEDLSLVRQLAQEEASHDHWLQTNKLSYEARFFLSTAAVFAMRCFKNNPYKCAIFMRTIAENFTDAPAVHS